MDDGYNIQAINLAISAVNNFNDEDLERNRKLLIDAAQEYQELSKAIEDINKRRKVNKKISIGDYVEQKLGEDRDWLKAVREQLWLSSPLHEHSIAGDLDASQSRNFKELKAPDEEIKSEELEFTDLPVEERINVIENRGGGEFIALNSKENDLSTSEVDVFNMVENYERTILLVDKEDSSLGSPESSKGASPIKLGPGQQLWSHSPVIEGSVTPLPNSSENFVSYDATKEIINFKVKSDNESIEDKFHYNKEPDQSEIIPLNEDSIKYLSENYTKEKEQKKILDLLQKASTDTIKTFSDANLDKDFFIAVMNVASKNHGITTIKGEKEFEKVLEELNPPLRTGQYTPKVVDTLYKIAKYFSAKFQNLSEKDGYLTARKGRGTEVNKTPRRLFRVCTKENIQAFQNMKIEEIEQKEGAQEVATKLAKNTNPLNSPRSASGVSASDLSRTSSTASLGGGG